MTQEIEDAGGEWIGNPEDEGAIGWDGLRQSI